MNEISKSIVQEMGVGTHGIVIQYKQQVQSEIKKWIDTKKKLDERVRLQYENRTTDLGRYSQSSHTQYDISSKNLRKLYQNYAEQKGRIRELQSLDKIAEHYKKGYQMIHKIREDLTGQDITYSVLYKEKGKLMEAHLNLDQILSAVKITYMDIKTMNTDTDLSNFLNLSIRNASISKIVHAKLDKNMKELETLSNELDSIKLWDRLAEIHRGQNFGYVYEVYKTLRTSYSAIDYIGEDQMDLEQTLYHNARSNNVPGWQAGDVGLEQLKAVFKSAANLMSVSTIETVLQKIYDALSSTTSDEMIQALTKLFTSQLTTFDTKLDEVVEEEAIKAIKETIIQRFDKA